MKITTKQPGYLNNAELEQTLRQLGCIAGTFSKNSLEEKAIRIASEALLCVHSEIMAKKFADFMLSKNRVLTSSQILHLRAMGIDPDSSPASENHASQPSDRSKSPKNRTKRKATKKGKRHAKGS